MSQFDVAAVFAEELDKAVQSEVDHSGFAVQDWFGAGRLSGPEAIAKWHVDGPGYVQAFIDWYEYNPDVEIWVTPDGTPAIELPFEVAFGSVQVRGYIDLVLKIGTALVVVDWKTSAKTPDSNRQLAIYACGIEQAYGIRPRYGTFFMCRGTGPRMGPKTHFLRPVELDRPQYSLAYLTAEFEAAERGIQVAAFPANPGEQCGRCPVAWVCTEAAGPKARELDPNYPGAKRG